ncbi:endolytic transglycosylase MltG [Microbacterium betulae]|uniref:Endolytic murein transglycosylase n=1 Tax=Microbacterium betulae TaxID=2981139 RepID=A0AA97FEA2_9MICO|nr:endolytic transglycosylase MltG [Microbacterium sp. AB]WOF21533.1 endolytic transglycosylase MltG [Microbacterium sp. AB]
MPETSNPDPERPLTRRERRAQELAAESRRTLPSAAAHDAASGPPITRPPADAAPQGATIDEATARGERQPAGLDDLFTPETVGRPAPRKGSRLGCLISIVIVLVLLGGVAAGGLWAWNAYGDRISAVMGWDGPHDYEEGDATGEALVTVADGDTGEAVSASLHEAGVTLESDSFYQYLLDSGENPTFYPGVYRLQQKMTSAAALDALEDPETRLENTVLITEGSFAADALVSISEVTEIPLEELQAEAADYTQFGIPADAPSIEGFLFPATYTFEPDATAEDVIRVLVDEMFERLDGLGVPEEDRLQILTMAALVQRESGGEDDMAQIARVFFNRVDEGMLLQSDATVAYGADSTHTVWTTDEQRADESNPYNTYVHQGLPVGPIGLPGEAAIQAAMSPADGDWLYFVPVDLATGETVFSSTLAEHEAAVERLQEWCRASAENAVYCE